MVVKLFSQFDGNRFNDTVEVFVKKIPVISEFPYEEGFEQGSGGWQPAGERISWAVGVPTGPSSNPWISAAGEGNRAWVTNLTGLYNKSEYSFLESNCFDFSGMTADPIFAFLHTHDLETTLDLSWVEYSINGGRSWQKLGDHLSGVSNWYNSFTKKAWTSTSGAGAGVWQEAAHRLTGLAGKRVRLRFVMLSDGSLQHEGVGIDRVRILNPFDLAVKDILSPGDNCGGSLGSAESITVRVVNKGFFPVSGYAMGLKVDNQTYPVEPIAGTLASGDSLDYTFSATGDFSVIGAHFITVAAAFSGDNNTTDNQRVERAGNFLPPDVNLGKDTVACGGQVVVLDPRIPNAQYLWSNNTTNPQLNVTSTGFYTLELTDGNGCVGRDSVQVVVPPQLGFKLDDLEEVKCYGDSTGEVEIRILGGFPPYSLRWETGDTIRILEDLAAGFYAFRVVDGFGCELIDSVEMIQNDSVAADIDALVDAGCPEDSTGAILITPTGGEGPYNYLWSNFSKKEDLTRIPEGQYRVSITDVNGCEFLSPFYQVVTNDTLPRANFNYIISGGTVVFQDLSLNAVNYKWSFGDGSPVVSDPNPFYTYEENDTFPVVLIASNSCGIDTFVQYISMTTVSIEAPEFPAKFTLYPNPVVGDGFYLKFEEARLTHVSVAIMQTDGKQLYREELGTIWDSKKIHIPRKPSWAEGLYLVVISSDEGRVYRKVMFRH